MTLRHGLADAPPEPRPQPIRLETCLSEVTRGVGDSWRSYRVVGVTRNGQASAKESVGKAPGRYKLVLPGSIYYNPMRILLGSIAMIDHDEEAGITSPDYVVFRTREGVLNHRWFYYWLRSDQGADFIRGLTRGAVRERMLFRRLASAELFFPPYERQLEFVLSIGAFESARRAAIQRLDGAESLFAAHTRACFESKEARVWPRLRLADLLAHPLKTGVSGPLAAVSDKRCLTLAAIRGGHLDPSCSKPVDVTEGDAVGNWVQPDTWYVVRGNGNISLVGRGGLAPADIPARVLYPDLLIRVACDPSKISTEYLRFAWDCPQVRREIESRARTAAGIHKINQANLADIPIPVPLPAVQTRIARALQERQQLVEQLRKASVDAIQAIEQIPAALLRQAAQGRH